MDIINIEIVNAKGNTNYKGGITKISIPEKLIIDKSIEFFSDEAPCFIHRSAVMKRLFLEFEEYLLNILDSGNNQVEASKLPNNIKTLIKEYESYSYIKFNKI